MDSQNQKGKTRQVIERKLLVFKKQEGEDHEHQQGNDFLKYL
jgi:hypothetical protein